MSPEHSSAPSGPRRPWPTRVRDIIEAIDEIDRFVAGMSRAEFLRDAKTQKATLANFQIIGEATSHIPREVQDRYPATPWRLMRQMRNVVVHAYFAVEPAIVWQTISDNLPPLKTQLLKVLAENVHLQS